MTKMMIPEKIRPNEFLPEAARTRFCKGKAIHPELQPKVNCWIIDPKLLWCTNFCLFRNAVDRSVRLSRNDGDWYDGRQECGLGTSVDWLDKVFGVGSTREEVTDRWR